MRPFALLCLLFFLLVPSTPLFADEKAAPADSALTAAQSLLDAIETQDRRQGFEYQAETFVFYEQGDSILLRGNPASVTHRGAQLEAAEMVYWRTQEVVVARARLDSAGVLYGEPVLKRGDEVLRGTRILYDLKEGQGTIQEGQIHRDKGYYAGERIRTLSAGEFHVHKGSYSTCDYSEPHFDFYSPRIKVLMADMAIARPVYFRIAKKRVFWIPFYIFSLRKDRQSGILTPSFGNRPVSFGSSQSEWELRNLGYYLAPNDYWDLTLSGALRQRSGWLARLKLAYALRYRWNGQVETQFENRQTGNSTQRAWRVDLRHNQELSPTAKLRASGTFQSNKSFGRDNSTDLQERLNRTLRSNLSYSKRWQQSGNSLSLNASQTKNLDAETFDVVLPDISFRKARKPLWGQRTSSGGSSVGRTQDKPWYSQIYYDGSARLRNAQRGTAADTSTSTSADLSFRLSSQYKPFSWLQFSPGLTETWRDADLRRASSRSLRKDQLNGTLALTQTFYGLFHPPLWRVNALRHALKPNLSLSYQAARADTGGVFGLKGDSGSWKQARRLNVRLDNTFWAKVEHREEELKVRLAQFNFSTSYDFEDKITPLADLNTTLSIAAGRYFDTRLSMRSEFYDGEDNLHLLSPRLKQFEVRSSVRYTGGRTAVEDDRQPVSRPSLSNSRQEDFGYQSGLRNDIRDRGRGRRLQLSHYYSRTRSITSTSTRSWLRASTGFSLGRARYADYTLGKWHFSYSINYNLHDPNQALLSADRITSELLSVQREFHDWTATLNLEPSRFHKDHIFYFKAQLKEIPQIKFERGDSRRL